MPANVTKARLDEFVAALGACGGRAGNRALRKRLKWDDEEFYWRVQGRLIEEGSIEPGRGQGGSVRLLTRTESENQRSVKIVEPVSELTEIPKTVEKDLYIQFRDSIKDKWINRFGFDDLSVDETHTRGSKDTGGTFTRPDITVVGITRYQYLPKTLDVITFEIKTGKSINIMGVLEAIAHREAANRAYVVYNASRSDFDSATEATRIFELAQKYGVGIILAPAPSVLEDWDIPIDAVRNEPDPARLNRFLLDHPSKDTREKLQKWRG